MQPLWQHIIKHLAQGSPSLAVEVASLNVAKWPTQVRKTTNLQYTFPHARTDLHVRALSSVSRPSIKIKTATHAHTASIAKHVPASTSMCPKRCHKKKISNTCLAFQPTNPKTWTNNAECNPFEEAWQNLGPYTLNPKLTTQNKKTNRLLHRHNSRASKSMQPRPYRTRSIREETRTLWETCLNKKLENHSSTHSSSI